MHPLQEIAEKLESVYDSLALADHAGELAEARSALRTAIDALHHLAEEMLA